MGGGISAEINGNVLSTLTEVGGLNESKLLMGAKTTLVRSSVSSLRHGDCVNGGGVGKVTLIGDFRI